MVNGAGTVHTYKVIAKPFFQFFEFLKSLACLEIADNFLFLFKKNDHTQETAVGYFSTFDLSNNGSFFTITGAALVQVRGVRPNMSIFSEGFSNQLIFGH